MSTHDLAHYPPLASWERGRYVIEFLLRLGVRYFVFASGAQSSPLIHALYSIKTVDEAFTHLFALAAHIDERAGSYHALGYMRKTGRPAVIIVTSGTALANVMPAVVEAAKCELPLIVLSADRPPELLAVRSNQTIDQLDFYGKFAATSVHLPLVQADFSVQNLWDSLAGNVNFTATAMPSVVALAEDLAAKNSEKRVNTKKSSPKPVPKLAPKGVHHFNVPFRKPLIGEWDSRFAQFITPETLAILYRNVLAEKQSAAAVPFRRYKATIEKHVSQALTGAAKPSRANFKPTQAQLTAKLKAALTVILANLVNRQSVAKYAASFPAFSTEITTILAVSLARLLIQQQYGHPILLVSGTVEGMAYAQKKYLAGIIRQLSFLVNAPIFVDIASPLHCLSPNNSGDDNALGQAGDEGMTHDKKSAFPWVVTENLPLILGTYAKTTSAANNKHKFARTNLYFKTILHIGSEVVNSAYLQWLQKYPPEVYIHLEHVEARYDPATIFPPHGTTTLHKLTTDLVVTTQLLYQVMHAALTTLAAETDIPSSSADEPENNRMAPSDPAKPNHPPQNPVVSTSLLKILVPLDKQLKTLWNDYVFAELSELAVVRALGRAATNRATAPKLAPNLALAQSPTSALQGAAKAIPTTTNGISPQPNTADLDWILFLGNSMPVRSFALVPELTGFQEIFVSRGCSGIDGLIAQGTGIAAASANEELTQHFYKKAAANQTTHATIGAGTIAAATEDFHKKILPPPPAETAAASSIAAEKFLAKKGVIAVLGDLSALHDLNALLFCKNNPTWLVGIIVINNHEGTIFNHLPIKSFMQAHWKEFTFHHELSFEGMATMIGMDYIPITRSLAAKHGLETLLSDLLHRKKSFLCEITVAAAANFNEHRCYVQAAEKIITAYFT